MAEFTQGDYRYTINKDTGGGYSLSAIVIDKTKTTYEDIPASVTYQGATYFVASLRRCFYSCTSLTQAPVIPDSVTNMNYCFYSCTSLTQAPVIPDSVTNMNYCFSGCTSLTQAPVIPDSVASMNYCFDECTSLAQAPAIPDSVAGMTGCFYGCASLTQVPVIPDSVASMNYCFYGCASLIQAPVIPNNVTNMSYCFYGCTSLTQSPVIPNSVTNMLGCFYMCTSLTQAPVIPDSVTDMRYCFYDCTSLTGDVYVLMNNNKFSYMGAFADTTKTIFLHAYYNGEGLAKTSSRGNVIVDNVVTPIILNTQFVESGAYRVDMLLTGHAGSITGMIPNVPLYDMNGNEIEFGVGNNNLPDYSRCYAIIQTTNQVPTTNINITIMNVASSSKYIPASTSVPSTATPCQIKQEGESSLISARTDVGSVRFNPIGTGLDTYNVGALLNRFGVQTSSNYTKTQTNLDNDIKHCVTHAQNVMIDSTTTLQDWITEQYNNLA